MDESEGEGKSTMAKAKKQPAKKGKSKTPKTDEEKEEAKKRARERLKKRREKRLAGKDVKKAKTLPGLKDKLAGKAPSALGKGLKTKKPAKDEMVFGEEEASPEAGSTTPEEAKKALEAAKAKNTAMKNPPKEAEAPTKAPSKKNSGFGTLVEVLDRTLVKETTGYKGVLRESKLAGIKSHSGYDSIRLRPSGKDYGVGLQVWTFKNTAAASRKFSAALQQYPNPKRSKGLGNSSFEAGFGGVSYFGWVDHKSKQLRVLTCDKRVCAQDNSLRTLARRLHDRLPARKKK